MQQIIEKILQHDPALQRKEFPTPKPTDFFLNLLQNENFIELYTNFYPDYFDKLKNVQSFNQKYNTKILNPISKKDIFNIQRANTIEKKIQTNTNLEKSKKTNNLSLRSKTNKIKANVKNLSSSITNIQINDSDISEINKDNRDKISKLKIKAESSQGSNSQNLSA